jgi:ElaB/YqjD/DUF883 family membrane-anchored ribosome-binding protein
MARSAANQTQEVQAQFKDVADEIVTLAGMMKDLASSSGDELRGAAGERLAEIARRSQDLADKAKSKAKSEIATLEQAITEKPLQSALIALLVGLLLGAILRR